MVELLPSTWPFLPHSFPIPSSHGVALPGYPGAQFLQKGCWLPEAVETPGAGLASGRWVSGWPCGWWLWLHQWWQPWCLTTWWIDTPPVFAGVSEGSPEMEGIDTQLAELGIGGEGPWPLHKKRSWHPFLLASKKWRSDPIRRAYLFFSCMSMLPNQISDFCIPAG